VVILAVAQLGAAQNSGGCALCEFVVSKLEGWIGENSTEAEIINAVENVCTVIPSTLRSQCVNLIEAYGDEMIQMFLNKETPDVICKQLSLCSSARASVSSGALCALCEWVVQESEQYLAQNSTEAQIQAALDSACSDLPAALSSLCQTFVNTYASQIIQLLINKEDPATVCTTVGLCTQYSGPTTDDVPVLDDNLIAHVNAVAHWKAGRNARFEGVTVREAKKLLGTKLARRQLRSRSPKHATAVPVSFDSRKQWPHCIHPVRNQAQCGSCWAFGASESFSDRLCIATKNATNVVLSPQWIVSCDTTDYGCQGGYLQNAWEFMANTGVVVDSCDPYTSQDGNVAPCPSACSNGQPLSKMYKVDANTIQTLTDMPSIQQSMMTNGPVEAAFSVYQDFFSYTSGVYVHTSGGLMGGHAIKMVGWGVDSSTKQDYWIVYNSWGTSWGMNGLFWILRGVDECGIESNVVVGLPAAHQ